MNHKLNKFKKITFPSKGKVLLNQKLQTILFEVPSFNKDIYMYVVLDNFHDFYEGHCLNCKYYTKINDNRICEGIYWIEKDTDCYIAPEYVSNLLEYDSEVEDCLYLKIPTTMCAIEFDSNSIKLFMDDYIKDNKLYMYPLPFTNIQANGLLCFEDNDIDIRKSIYSGRFSSILELFWSSEFNHDLAGDTLELINTSNSALFHEELRKFLLTYFSPNKTNQDIIQDLKDKLNILIKCYEDTIDWKLYDNINNCFYILKVNNYIVLVVTDKASESIIDIYKFKLTLSYF